MEKLLTEIETYTDRYEFNFQFWGYANNNVYIYKGGVEMASFGGRDSIFAILKKTVQWLRDKNPKK